MEKFVGRMMDAVALLLVACSLGVWLVYLASGQEGYLPGVRAFSVVLALTALFLSLVTYGFKRSGKTFYIVVIAGVVPIVLFLLGP